MTADISARERLLLTAIKECGDDAYGITIQQAVYRATGAHWSLGRIYNFLEALEARGVITSAWGRATPERGGYRKRLYRLAEASNAG